MGPHLASRGIWVSPLIVQTSRDAFGRKRKGGGQWKHWHRDLMRLIGQQPGQEARFTTMFDLYGLPDDFPGLDQHAQVTDTARRALLLEAAMARAVDDTRFVPYVQLHEFEALVLASLDSLALLIEAPEDRAGLTRLAAIVQASSPEAINDGPDTAPSKRLTQHLPTYRKTVHGPLATETTGLATLRAACPHFGAWVARLETL